MSAEAPSPRPLSEAVDVFDTTLRDGSQKEGMSLTVDDKLRVAAQLDLLGVAYIEGGWPGANPKDDEFFQRAPSELKLDTSTLVAFGSTRRAKGKADDDETLRNLVKANTSVVCIVAKAWDRHVVEALRTDLDEAVAMAFDSVEFLRHAGLRVFFDAEHFFDGYKSDPEFSLGVLLAAEEAGAECLVLCDTNGGTLPQEVERIVDDVRGRVSGQLGVHFHNDGGCAVANTLTAVRGGATHVQGCINGYGERTGNADLCAVIANLSLKMGVRTIPADRLDRLTQVSHHIAELVNIAPNPQQPYVGQSAFTHKAGLHTSAIARRKDLYEHVAPEGVGNTSRVTVSELSGRSTVQMKAEELGLDLDAVALVDILEKLKALEYQGYHFEVADGSLELLMRESGGWRQAFFRLESFRVITEQREDGKFVAEATIKVHIGDERVVATAEGNGPVNALDAALRQALGKRFPSVNDVHLTDYKVRVLDTSKGTGAVTRVLLDSTDGDRTWATIGVSSNIIEASWEALSDSFVYGLLHSDDRAAQRPGERES
ncbi:MAG: citramalate synthase [Actinobacteria bacterium]|nr:citramalate synthase [Actinomycetota bacterium]